MRRALAGAGLATVAVMCAAPVADASAGYLRVAEGKAKMATFVRKLGPPPGGGAVTVDCLRLDSRQLQCAGSSHDPTTNFGYRCIAFVYKRPGSSVVRLQPIQDWELIGL